MKNIFTVLILLFTITVFSQIREKGDIEVVPFIGFSQANYLANQYLGSPVEGVHFGINADYFINNRWSIRSGIMVQKMGSEGNFFYQYKETLNYLTVPINANWHFGSTRKWYLNFGPSIGILTSAKAKTTENDEDIKNLVKNFQVGLSVGIGYKIKITESFSIMLDHYENIGLMEVNKSNDGDIVNVFSSFNVGAVLKL